MTFLQPSFLWALTALALPVIIHLFNFRKYKKVYFTNVKFLRQVQIETKSKSRLRELLVLLFRMLMLAALVLAFSQPVIRDKNNAQIQAGSRYISLYIDNSFSMENLGRNGPLLDQARQKAKELVNAFGIQDKFQVLTNEFQGKQQRFCDKQEAIALIDEIRSSAVPRKLNQVIERQRELLNGTGSNAKRMFILSDAQKSTFNLLQLQKQDSTPIALVPFAPNLVNNVFIDSCWFESPVQQSGEIQHLRARIVNKGDKTIESGSAKLLVNGNPIALSSFTLLPGALTELRFTFECKTSGLNFGSVKIDDYPVTFDDVFYFAFNSQLNIPVYLINGNVQSGDALQALFSNDSLFQVSIGTESQINYSTFRKVEVIVLNQLKDIPSGLVSELQRFSEKGGAIIVLPADAETGLGYTGLLSALNLPGLGAADTSNLRVEKIELASGFYSGVFEKLEEDLNLPLIKKHYRLNKNSRNDFEALLKLINGDILLGRSKFKQAEVYLFSASLNNSSGSFGKHALFVPTFYRMCFAAIKQAPLYYPVISNTALYYSGVYSEEEMPPRIVSFDSTMEVIPELRNTTHALKLFTRDQITRPGFYTLKKGNKTLQALAFNYERLESDLSCYSIEELENHLSDQHLSTVKILNANEKDFTEQVLQGSEPKRLWKLFIILALVFLLAESVVLRILK